MKTPFTNVMSSLLLVSFLLIVSVTTYIVILGGANDYGLFILDSLIDDLNGNGNLPSEVVDISKDANDIVIQWIFYIDDIWLAAYIFFSMVLLFMSYYSERSGIFTFTNMVYIMSMFFLFVLDVVIQVNTWFLDNFLIKLLPSVEIIIPNFLFFLDNLGIILTIQLLVYMAINFIDLDFSKHSQRKVKEDIAAKEELL